MPAPPATAVYRAASFDIAANAAAQAAQAALNALYPCSDGMPMADNMSQSRAMMNAASDLEVTRREALVALDVLVYPQEGNPRNRIAPDVLVAFGVGTDDSRLAYLTWMEGKPPDWVLEVASPATPPSDLRHKRRTYAEMGVPEYWLFDPMGGLFPPGQPRLQGLKLVAGEYIALEERFLERRLRVVRSAVLDLDLRAEGALIRFRDPATGKDVLRRAEVEALLRRFEAERKATERGIAEERVKRKAAERRFAEARARREAAERRAAEARVVELEAAFQRALQSRTPSSEDPP